MGSKARRSDEVSRRDGNEAAAVVGDQLEALARQGARRLLMEALDEEGEAYFQRGRYERHGRADATEEEDAASMAVFRGYRYGSSPRRLILGGGTIDLKAPRVRDIPKGQDPYESRIIRKYQRRSDTIDETFLKRFIEGLATRDFEPAPRLLMGVEAPLSASVISRLTRRFKEQYEAFDRQDIKGITFVYI